MDGRLYPAVVKLLETVTQSLTQMRSLSIVDESPDLASAVEMRVTFTRARRYVPHVTRHMKYIGIERNAGALTSRSAMSW